MNNFSEVRLLTPEEGASTLEDCAHIPMDQKNLALVSDDLEVIESLNALLCLTKTAIIINWLRLVEKSSADSARATSVLIAFERLTFSHVPAEQRNILLGNLRRLISSTTELQCFIDNKSVSQKEVSGVMLQWCKSWLGSVFEDEDFLKRTTLMFGGGFIAVVHGAISSLGKTVQAVLFEKQEIALSSSSRSGRRS